MNKLFFTLVCHAELGLSGTWAEYEEVQPEFDAMLERVANRCGKPLKVTYCVTTDFLNDKLEDAFNFVERGHEIGVHSHLPGSHRHGHRYDGRYRLRFDSTGRLNQDQVAKPLQDIIVALGLPRPTTHVSGMFSFQKRTVEMLVEAGFLADCSLIPNGQQIRHPATGDFVIADNRRRCVPTPYFPDIHDPWSEGCGDLLEIPVAGNIGGAYFAMDGFQGLEDEERQLVGILEAKESVGIYQSYWHHFEFSRVHSWTRGSLLKAEEFLYRIGMLPQVTFSTIEHARQAFCSQFQSEQGRGANALPRVAHDLRSAGK